MYRNITPVVKNIIIINILLFLSAWILPSFFAKYGVFFNFNDKLGLHYVGSKDFNVLQMFTYMFMHANIPHLFFNMFALFMFGQILEHVWGSQKFLFYYLLAGLGAGFVQQLFWYIDFNSLFSAFSQAISTNDVSLLLPYSEKLYHYFRIPNFQLLQADDLMLMKTQLANALVTIGASGSVFGLLLAFGWLFPEERLYLMFIPIPIKARYFVAGYAVVELFLGVAQFSGDQIAHFAHLGGMLFGLVAMLYWKKQGKLYSK